MTEQEAKDRAIAFMKSQREIYPWAFHGIGFISKTDIEEFNSVYRFNLGLTRPHWVVGFSNESPEYKDQHSYTVIIDGRTGAASFSYSL